MNATPISASDMSSQVQRARERLDAYTREIVQWHFDEATGCPFWLEKKREQTLGETRVVYFRLWEE